LPRVGELYRVDVDGFLRWYNYLGAGQLSPDASVNWANNSGNRISSGWQIFKFLCGGGDGHLFAIEQNGDLRWYGYKAGDGVEDPNATRGWESNSGNIIGNGFGNFLSVVCTPLAGPTYHTLTPCTLYCIEPNGDLRFYRYVGDGTADRTGRTGWAPNSGNRIGNGWNNFRAVFTAGQILFGVEPNGDLRWYIYAGDGAQDDYSGWVPGSGAVVGRGWNHFTHIVGGPDDNGTFGNAVYAVKPDGGLYWYKYLGYGETDTSGHIVGWQDKSGNQIGKGW
jgi:hypothetical protein